ncbi:hypothetical protein [Nodosilinea sp. E11]|uniref:hypothetical protein n=1 Tax=Nodosilinea sp. E11 TaxID=3037479 RepID=UPI002934CFC0|nr:hypothetical protein [Nodosilinea sp. E11]WOD37278.1 hypothetical protein RRF56_02180 [Nodosilinea sp. E11]
MTLIKDLIDIPDRIQTGDFVLRLTEGVNQVEQTLAQYVVTPELKDCFDNALSFIRSALQSNSSKASYLHGSFGSGKSHFMAVLNLILQGIPEARGIKELAPAIAKHNEWIAGKKFLLVPYHMIGATSMESGILGGYVDYVRRTHPDAPIPGVYQAEGLFEDAQKLRASMGDDAFFQALSQADPDGGTGWGKLEGSWDAQRFQAAIATPPMPTDEGERSRITLDEKIKLQERQRLVGSLVGSFFSTYQNVAVGEQENFVSLDQGLSIISRHAHNLGYDALILFLDELILWLASRATDINFIHREGQKLAKLVEAQMADRPIPIISFVARQRDLSELIGDGIPGAERLNFSDALRHWEGRFHRITLEDRNLPAIAEKRVLKCKTPAAREQLDASFEQATQVREAVMNVLLTREGDREMFRQVYPFSPALVQTLIAVSSVLQRERTALKLMMQLLVTHRETLSLGDIIPVGDLFDEVAHGDEAFSPDMALHFDNAKRLYHLKLLPLLEREYGNRDDLAQMPLNDPKRVGFRNDDRLVKTLLLSALVPEVESLRGLNAERLAALNHGTIRTPIPGREAGEVLRRCRAWAGSVGEIRVGEENSTNPTITVQLTGVDTDSILRQAEGIDNRGNRIRLVRSMVFAQIGISGDETECTYDFVWKNTKRSCVVLFMNIRESEAYLPNLLEDRWKLIIDFPFDEGNHGPSSDWACIQNYLSAYPEGTQTLCWIPQFFSADVKNDLGKLVILEHILTGDRIADYTAQLSPQDRQTAKTLLENQRSILRQQFQNHLYAVYGISNSFPNTIDQTHSLEASQQFVSLKPGFELRPPTAANLGTALTALLDQALGYEFPAAPAFEADVNRLGNLEKVLSVASQAAQDPQGRAEVDRALRGLVRQIANPLLLGEMGADATHFVLGQHWKNHFLRKSAEAGGAIQVGQLRRWINEPKPMGLPTEVQNLVILVYAQQTGRSFYRHHVAIDPSLKALPDDCELREQKLPDATQWKTAVDLARDIFHLSISPLCKASTVDELVSKVKAETDKTVESCRDYATKLQAALSQFELPAEGDRLTTAKATAALVERLHAKPTDEIIATLAQAEIATTATAMGECLSKANSLVSILDQASWDIYMAIQALTDDRHSPAQAILAEVRQALTRDEHVLALGSALKQAQAAAVQLLSRPVAPPPRPPEIPSPLPSDPFADPPELNRHKGKQVIDQGSAANLDVKSAQDRIVELSKALSAGQTLSLSLSWIIEEGKAD